MLLRNAFTRDARVLREARSLAAAGHEVTVVAIRVGDLPREEHVDGFRVLRAVEAKPWMGPTILGTGATTSEEATHRSGAKGIAVTVRDRALEPLFRRAAGEIPADAIHAHDLNTLSAGAALARRFGVPLVYDAHELYPDLTGLSDPERRFWSTRERALIRHARAVIAPTASRAQLLAQRYGIAEPTVVMNCPDPPPAGLDDDRLEVLRSPGERLVVYAGGFTPNRGLPNLIRAAGDLDGLRLVLLGWGPLEPLLREAAAPFGGRIVFAGAVEPDLVVPVCAHADIGVVPYEPVGLNNQLAAPNKLFEYLHAGLAIAGSDLPDVRAIIDEHTVGVTLDARDPNSIRTALTTLRDSDLAAMRARARAAAPAYTWASQAERLLALYADLR